MVGSTENKIINEDIDLIVASDLDLNNTKYIKSKVNRSSPDITKVRSLGRDPIV